MTDQLQAIIVAALFAPLPVIILATVISVSRRAVDGRLPPNKKSGLRTPATMSSDRAWVAGHGAALRLTPLLVAVTVIGWIGLFVTAWAFKTVVASILAGFVVGVVVIAALIFVTFVANKAAKAVSGGSDGRLQ